MHPHPAILIVGTNPRNLELLGDFLTREGYMSVCAQRLEQVDEIIRSRTDLTVALVDLSGFNASIWQRCQDICDKNIQLLVISQKQNATIENECRTRGAQGVLVKPLVMRELTDLIQHLMSNKQ